jgi:hypothetical protein
MRAAERTVFIAGKFARDNDSWAGYIIYNFVNNFTRRAS